MKERLNILIWHIHGTYLNNLTQAPHNFYLPIKPGRPEGYGGKGRTFIWPKHVWEVPAEEVRSLPLDLVIYQTPGNFFQDRFEILSPEQQRLPKIYLEHNAPREHPTDTKHPIDDPNVLLIHVTHFNNLMWDSGRTPTRVIVHGVKVDPGAIYTGELARGVVVVNGIQRRARISGYDLFQCVRQELPLDLIGMESEALNGLGDIPHVQLHRIEARYRFFFHPIRYTSLALALLEAMMIGLPIVCLATTELPTTVEDGYSGFISNNLDYLIERMRFLLDHPDKARELGRNARQVALERFNIKRFVQDWESAFRWVIG